MHSFPLHAPETDTLVLHVYVKVDRLPASSPSLERRLSSESHQVGREEKSHSSSDQSSTRITSLDDSQTWTSVSAHSILFYFDLFAVFNNRRTSPLHPRLRELIITQVIVLESVPCFVPLHNIELDVGFLAFRPMQ